MYDNGVQVAKYDYNLDGTLNKQTNANNTTTTYTYNKANLVKTLENKSGTSSISKYEYSYLLDGSQSQKKINGVATYYEYDSAGRLLKEITPNQTYTYTYTPVGNRQALTVTGTNPYNRPPRELITAA